MSEGLSELSLPDGWVVHTIEYLENSEPDQQVVLKFAPPIPCVAIEKANGASFKDRKAKSVIPGVEILTIPQTIDEESLTPGPWLNSMKAWVEKKDASSSTLTLQGAFVIYTSNRIAVRALPDRLKALIETLIEYHFYQTELMEIESELATLWPSLESDAPLAFEIEEKTLPRKDQLAERFLRVLRMRARLARIIPMVNSPHLHPPTLASQLSERLRDRARLTHRLESLSTQLEVFERIYDACGQRASDHVLARKGHILEWVIIIMLLSQTLLVLFEIITMPRR